MFNVNTYNCVHIFKDEQIEVHRYILPLDCRFGNTARNVSADRNVHAYRMLDGADINMSQCSKGKGKGKGGDRVQTPRKIVRLYHLDS